MEFDPSPVNEINGINLDNYVARTTEFNTVIYVHKKFLKNQQAYKKAKVKNRDVKKEVKSFKVDKSVNCDIKGLEIGLHDDAVINKTIKFAKDLAPLVLPPSESDDPVSYTVKTCTKNKNKEQPPQSLKRNKIDTNTANKTSKKLIETYRKEKMDHRDSYSGRESISQSSQSNTLDDIHMNPSLSCTITNESDKRETDLKRVCNHKRRKQDTEPPKFAISESFAGIAKAINNTGETKIKIQLMNEKEKDFLTESIRAPIVNAVKDCISELNGIEVKEELRTLQKAFKCQSQKLNTILDRLTCIEKHLANNVKALESPRAKIKASRLEQLGEDIDEKDLSSEEESATIDIKKPRCDVSQITPRDNRIENLGGGEFTAIKATTSVGVRTDKPSRLPARFCWTDATK